MEAGVTKSEERGQEEARHEERETKGESVRGDLTPSQGALQGPGLSGGSAGEAWTRGSWEGELLRASRTGERLQIEGPR